MLAAPETHPARPTAHDVAERDKLIRSWEYAEHIRRDPALIVAARNQLSAAYANGYQTVGQSLWARLLDLNAETVIGCMTADDEIGRLLRSNNPFSMTIGSHDEERRRISWQRAKEELSVNAN